MKQHLANKSQIYSIQDLQRHYEAKTKGHWFKPDTMRFFRSKIHEKLFYSINKIYFISSERGPWDASPRRYSIRSYDPESGFIDTVGDFQKYKTLAAAQLAARRLALNG